MITIDKATDAENLRNKFGLKDGPVLAVTGHRIQRLARPGVDPLRLEELLTGFAEEVLDAARPSVVLTGMATGWDQAVAAAAIKLEVPFVAAVPYVGQDSLWDERTRRVYGVLLEAASAVCFVEEPPHAGWKMISRNRWMVDRAELLVALWDGDRKGGTASTVLHAEKRGVQVVNCWQDWDHFQKR
jgi:uncharacterized phage-like protein YoqJ